jgi:serine/threonine-protein kinase
MDTQRWELAGSIFERLLGAPQEKRDVLLETLCGADAELKNVVLSMLQSESSASRFDRALQANEIPTAAVDAVDSPDSLPGGRVGPWLLVRKVGTGGMGVVWLGERVDGQFQQRAALKLIKRGMDSEAVLKRFLRERQILARLVHPHIAHLLDGGIAADGRPYFAMEYVEGLPLLRYCHERGIHLEERIRLFLRVCDAVQFAHANHVVHRDLKPSNILITAGGDVKLLDFGIAKLLESEDGAVETITQLQRERPMTPMYAAPEQIRGERITEATDVYALGCVLYELLTGQHARDLSKAANIKEVLQIVETTDPVAPSRLKFATMPVARKRLRGDLDTIVLTALRREPARRYASAEAFAADLKNYLDGKPILARGDNIFYRTYKRVRRHRAALAAVGAIAVIAIGATLFELRPRHPAAAVASGSGMAIVDFNNLSQSAESAWLAPALAEMLATELAIGSAVHVLPDELVRAARADLAAPLAGGYSPQSLATLRKRLGADFVLSGSYFVAGDADNARLRLDLALQDARSGVAIANVAQSGALAELPALVEKAGVALREKSGIEPPSAKQVRQADLAQPPSTAVARRMGLALEALSKSDPAKARDELMEALALAPGYAPAYLQLARAWKKLG